MKPDIRAVLHTPPGAGGIAVVVLSGLAARAILAGIFRPRRAQSIDAMATEELVLGDIVDGSTRLDEAIVAVREQGGPPVIEINIHGGPRVTQRLLDLLARRGAQVAATAGPAECWPLSADWLDNPAIGADLIEVLPKARTRKVVSLLCAQWSAGLSRLVAEGLELCQMPSDGCHGRSRPCGRARTCSQASMAPESDNRREPGSRAAGLADALRQAAERWPTVARLLDPPEVVLAGPPNAGKSSLANALLGRAACIVSEMPGTTRDWVRELADIDGVPVWLTDTAGLWNVTDAIDAEAVARAWGRIDQADLVLAVFDAADSPDADDENWRRLLAEPHVLAIANKADLSREAATGEPVDGVRVSAETGQGIEAMCRGILGALGLGDLRPDQPVAFTQLQADLLIAAAEAIDAGRFDVAAASLRELLHGAGA